MAMQKKDWMTSFFFKEFRSFFKKYVPSIISFINKQLLILDGHGSNITIKAISQAQEMGLDIITLPSYTYMFPNH
jgi:hypothetical protein